MKTSLGLLVLALLLLTSCESAKPRVELRQGQANTTPGTAPSDTKK